MVLGRLTHYAFDAILISTVFAGVSRTSGFRLSPPAMGIPEGTATTAAESYLAIGERVFDYTTAMSYSSAYFKRNKP